ncbi:MAG: hypothetical protein IIB06_10540, partial [Bacteroidetes bacterium]|nr:hypothetical protein [Bacteroidota bacterium]
MQNIKFYIPLKRFLFLLSIILLSYCGKVQAQATVVDVITPSDGFEIDGDLEANTIVVGGGDWVQNLAIPGGFVLNDNGTPVNTNTTLFVEDLFDTGADNVFTGGSKFFHDPNTWTWTNSSAGGKGDIHNAMYHLAKHNITGDEWIIIASDRRTTTGTSYIDFEFFQETLTTSGFGFTTVGLHGGRTINDILFTVEYGSGGSVASVFFYLWEESPPASGNYNYVLKTSGTFNAFGITNASSIPVIFGAFNNTTYSPLQFVEAAVNFTDIFGIVDPCLGVSIKTILIKTKSSTSANAALNDFVEPIQVTINIGTVAIATNSGPVCCDATSMSLDETGGFAVSWNWSSNGSAVITNTTDQNPTVTGFVDGEIFTVMITDANGCSVSDTTTITVEDTIDPTASNPSGISVQCVAPAPDILVVTNEADNCTVNPTVAFFGDVSDGNTCPEIITRTYSVTDDCGNSILVTQTITVNDTIPPVFDPPPADTSYQCIGDVPQPGSLGWTDNCDGTGSVTATDSSDGQTCPETITRTWSYTDVCGNPASVSQTITVNDTIPPVFDPPPADTSYQCIGDVPQPGSLGWTDNCDGTGSVTATDSSDGQTCPETITRTWSYTDVCGNPASVSQTITVNDTIPPVFDPPPADTSYQCIGDVPQPGSLGWTDNCDGTGS